MLLNCCICEKQFNQKTQLDLLYAQPKVCSGECFISYLKSKKNDHNIEYTVLANIPISNFKSEYETKIAQLLNKYKIKYLYEHLLIMWNNKYYIPDFYLPELNLFIETKGLWTGQYKKIFKYLSKKYPDNFILVTKEIFSRAMRHGS